MQKFGLCLLDLSKSTSPKLLNRIFRYCTQIVFGYVKLKFVKMVAPSALWPNGGIMAKDNLNKANLMQNF